MGQSRLQAKYGKASIRSMLTNLNRGIAVMDTFEKAGVGVGIFQITVSEKSGITARQASDSAWAANWAAKYLSSNMTIVAAKHPNFTGDVLLQATAASFNLGPYKFSGNPATIDVGSRGFPMDGYGANVLQLMECFR